jgi:outer membrane biosynthesis protein TonB
MRAAQLRSLCVLLPILCAGCSHKTPVTPQQAQAPPLKTGRGTLEQPKTTQQAEKTDTPLASPLPPPSAQSVPLPPPTPKKVRKPKKPKPADSPPATAGAPAASSNNQAGASSAAAQVTPPAQLQPATTSNAAIGGLTTGDSASGERTKHETSDLIGATQQGLSAIIIKRALTNDEKATAGQIHNYLKQAQQALENGDADGAHLLATKAKVLLDELMRP